MSRIPAFFHHEQLSFRPRYEYAFGHRLEHRERTERADNILSALEAESDRFSVREPEEQPLDLVAGQHAPPLLRLYETAARKLGDDETFIPTVFFRRDGVDPNPYNIQHSGYYCFDSGTPLTARARKAAMWSAACAVSAARTVRAKDAKLTYALSRPPGHHAGYDSFGGYCYLNNSALAARVLREAGRVAILDIDVHHGNGTQTLFWEDGDVLTVSIHADPDETFPFLIGYASECGAGDGKDRNINVPLPPGTDGKAYEDALVSSALPCIRSFDPATLIVATGVDAYCKDPVGNFELTTEDFHRIGELIGALGLPTCAVQEGGYYTPHIGRNVVAVLDGLREGMR